MLRPSYPIVTPRLVLRPYRPDDVDAMHAIQSRLDVTRYLYWGPRSRQEVAEGITARVRQTTLRNEGESLALVVALREETTVIGQVHLTWLSEANRQGELGFLFHPDHHGRGYATEAATEVLRLGFEGLGLHRIIGRADARNAASAKVMEKLGMRREAHFVQNEVVRGEWTDEVVYAMLAVEWAGR